MNVEMYAQNGRGERHGCWPRMGDYKSRRSPCPFNPSPEHDIGVGN